MRLSSAIQPMMSCDLLNAMAAMLVRWIMFPQASYKVSGQE
jgi:hypothetical protein